MFNKTEQEEDWSQGETNDLNEEKTYGMVEDEAKEKLIQNIRSNLINDPAVTKPGNSAYSNDNIQVKLISDSKAKIIKRGQNSVSVDLVKQGPQTAFMI
jgi:hypothetical protein